MPASHDDDNDDDDDDNLHLVACLCVCFVRALSSHIRHTPPHPLLGQDDDEDDYDYADEDNEEDTKELGDYNVDYLFSSFMFPPN